MGLIDSDAITEITITIPKTTAVKFISGGDDFFEAMPTVSNLIIKEMNRLGQEIIETGERVVIIKRLQEEGSMNQSSKTAPDCLKCLNGKTLREDEKCLECKRFCDNYGELFPMQ